MKRVTLSDIAEALGLSVPTVHRSINNLGRVSEQTRQLVLRKAQEMGYRANLSASLLSSKKKRSVALIAAKNLFYEDILSGFESSSAMFSSYGIETEFLLTDTYDSLEQTRLLESIMESGKQYAVIAIPPAHPLILNPLIKELIQGGAEVITYDNDAPDSGRKLFIGSNGYVSGKLCAQLYSSILPEGAKVAVLPSFVSAIGLKNRIRGFRGVCEEYGKLELVGAFEFLDDEQDAYSVCKQVLNTIKPDAVYSNSMMGNLGCCRAIADAGCVGKVFSIGYDYNPSIKNYIESGVLFGSVYQHPHMQGVYLANTIKQICLDAFEDPVSDIYMNTTIILKSNLEEYSEQFPPYIFPLKA